MQGYGSLSRPLDDLLKKDAFRWSDQAQLAFEGLKKTMISAPTLALQDFSKNFILETNASSSSIGAVLM